MFPRAVRVGLLAVVAVAALLAPALSPDPASALSRARFPRQDAGNRGTDVRTIQYLLRARGFPTLPADGIFGPGTTRAVRSFQARVGIPVTGVVGERTWPRLVVTLTSGARGDAVRALQVQLRAKYDASVGVTGTFDAATVGVLRRFQGHMGLARSGRADVAIWRNLVGRYEYPDFGLGNLCDYTDSTGGNGTAGNWGTASTIAQIEAAAARFARYGRGGVGIGDISLHHGGEIEGHSTHEVGLDVDVRPIRKDKRQCSARGGSTWRSSTYDRAATRTLIRQIRAAAPGQVKLIYFNDPVLIDEGHTVWHRGHDGHLHIRYCEATHADPRYRCATAGGPSAVGEASGERDGRGVDRPERTLRRAVLTGAGTEPAARAVPVPH